MSVKGTEYVVYGLCAQPGDALHRHSLTSGMANNTNRLVSTCCYKPTV